MAVHVQTSGSDGKGTEPDPSGSERRRWLSDAVARGRTPDGQDGPAGIDARARSVESISVLMAKSGVEASLRRHIHAALTEGLISAEEIGEVILHNCIYVGYPATWLALGIAREALDLVDAERPAGEGTKA